MKLAIGLGLTAVLAGEVFGLVATARDAGGLAALDFLEPRDKKTQFDGWKVRCGVYEAANTVEYDKASKVIRDYLRDPRWEKSNGGGVTMQGGTCVRLALSERDWIAVWVCNEKKSSERFGPYKKFAEAVEALPDVARKKCKPKDYDTHSFQIYAPDNTWSLLISRKKSIHLTFTQNPQGQKSAV
ncbi:hypothetical protein PCL_10835 [Purpureocillium lilacinum]|uniref:Uncharacterized protein n=1 Tax=Purpureocillium lilacinum TaxID=33203 RepID=A0A2U3ECJ5_PURLI|nr:hypothetical protein PCL_10835 [Purpureocillium lilacinum]GJN71334.1 hypothetical protein PLICBS_005397 [Purpureocillium lilacinum]